MFSVAAVAYLPMLNQEIAVRRQWFGREGRILALGAAQTFRELTNLKLIHLVLQCTQGNSKVFRRRRDVPAALFERAKNEIALERVRGLLEQPVAVPAFGFQLSEMKLKRQILVRDELLIADGDKTLNQIFELSNVARPPVSFEHPDC